VPGTLPLPRFLVRLVISAPTTVLPDLDPIRCIALGLIRLVVATLA
jgi:hypothetical protein